MKFFGDLCGFAHKSPFSYLCYRQNSSLCDIKFQVVRSSVPRSFLIIALKTAGNARFLKTEDVPPVLW